MTMNSWKILPLAAVLMGALATATSAAEGQTVRQSWTADRRDFAEGDIVTILIDEYTLASAQRGNFASDRRFRDLGVSGGQSISDDLPGSGGAEFSTSNQAESRRRDEATRQNRFQGEMTVRVVAIEPSGLLRVEGSKSLNLDGAVERLTLTGLVRPEDISESNFVDSWRVSDTEIAYDTRGNGPRGGIIGRVLGWIWP